MTKGMNELMSKEMGEVAVVRGGGGEENSGREKLWLASSRKNS